MSDTLAIYFNGDDTRRRVLDEQRQRHPQCALHELPADLRRLQRHRRAFQRRDLRGDDVAPASAVDRQGLEHRDPASLHRRRHELHGVAAGVRGHARRHPRVDHEPCRRGSTRWPARCTVWDAFAQFGSASAPTAIEAAVLRSPSRSSSPGMHDRRPTRLPGDDHRRRRNGTSAVQGVPVTFAGTATDDQEGA